jgi:hypothetical protein
MQIPDTCPMDCSPSLDEYGDKCTTQACKGCPCAFGPGPELVAAFEQAMAEGRIVVHGYNRWKRQKSPRRAKVAAVAEAGA